MTWQIVAGNCIDSMREMPEQSVQTVVTSPPYFGLRDYGTATWEGGDDSCEHAMQGRPSDAKTWDGTLQGAGNRPRPAGAAHRGGSPQHCECGATRVDDQIGLEATPDEFVYAMVEVFREVRRVLADDGTVWLNLGDSYAGAAGGKQGASGIEASREPCILAGSQEGDTVLDPFSGSGTTGMVALRHGRSYIGCELNPEYVELSRRRIIDDAPLLNHGQEAA